MNTSRRTFVSLGFPLLLFAGAASAQRGKIMHHIPQVPGGESTIPPPGQWNDPPKPDPRIALREKQEQIRKEVLHLYNLAGELKQEAEQTDSSTLLSIPMLKKTEQIQKIAKHIQSLARG